MKFEFVLFVVIALLIYDTYHNNKYTKWLYSFKRYYKMATYIGIAIFVYSLLKSDQPHAKQALYYGYNMLKRMPLNNNTVRTFSPIFDLTGGGSGPTPQDEQPTFMEQLNNMSPLSPAKTPTRRSVSETKKRWVAANQNWKCAHCGSQLDHTFEVDHRVRLEYSGSNDVNNLSALCRNCHGLKTAGEHMRSRGEI